MQAILDEIDEVGVSVTSSQAIEKRKWHLELDLLRSVCITSLHRAAVQNVLALLAVLTLVAKTKHIPQNLDLEFLHWLTALRIVAINVHDDLFARAKLVFVQRDYVDTLRGTETDQPANIETKCFSDVENGLACLALVARSRDKEWPFVPQVRYIERLLPRWPLEDLQLPSTFYLCYKHILDMHCDGLFIFKNSKARWQPVWQIYLKGERVLAFLNCVILGPFCNLELHYYYRCTSTIFSPRAESHVLKALQVEIQGPAQDLLTNIQVNLPTQLASGLLVDLFIIKLNEKLAAYALFYTSLIPLGEGDNLVTLMNKIHIRAIKYFCEI